MSEKAIISPSQVSMYTKCGEQYRRRYIEGEKIPPGIALLKGLSVHKGAEFNFTQKIHSRVNMDVSEVLQMVSDHFDQKSSEGLFLTKEEESVGKSKVLGKAKDSTIRMTDKLMLDIAPKYQPEFVEDSIKIELPDSSRDLLGILDMVDDRDTIVELKTSSKSWSQDRVDKDGQLTFQSLLFKAKHKRNPRKIRLENIIDKTKTEVKNFDTNRNDSDYDRLINRLNRVLDGINKGNYPPAHEGSWYCDPRYCGYYETCEVKP